jgi:Na+-transporting NADH:ubiquinone oxidoreductase subunit C
MMARIISMSNDSVQKTLFVAVALCLVCAVVVSAAAVALRPLQLANKSFDRRKNIVEVADLLQPGENVQEAVEEVEIRIVNLETGEYTDQFDPAAYDLRKAARDPALSEPIPPDLDIANIKRKAKYAPVYLIKEDGKIKIIILPVHGYGLWSTMYGFLALEGDTKTIHGLKFYEHAETPGLGGEITNPKWLAKWDGKVVYDEQWQPDIQVIKGTVDPNKPGAEHEVDGIAGATLTSRGVMHLMQYWLSDQGYGPFLARLRNQTQANRG